VAEDEKMERCRRQLEPEEQIAFEESKQSARVSKLSISETILMKYRRATELCAMYESKY